jgi:hypothetical protein
MNTELLQRRAPRMVACHPPKAEVLLCSLPDSPDPAAEWEEAPVACAAKRRLHLAFETWPQWSPILRFLPFCGSSGDGSPAA